MIACFLKLKCVFRKVLFRFWCFLNEFRRSFHILYTMSLKDLFYRGVSFPTSFRTIRSSFRSLVSLTCKRILVKNKKEIFNGLFCLYYTSDPKVQRLRLPANTKVQFYLLFQCVYYFFYTFDPRGHPPLETTMRQ